MPDVIGLGASTGVTSEAVSELLRSLLVDPGAVVAVATLDRKLAEPGLVTALRGWTSAPLVGFSAALLAVVEVPTPSEYVLAKVGTPSVAEAAALLAAIGIGPARLVVPKRRGDNVTAAVARVLVPGPRETKPTA